MTSDSRTRRVFRATVLALSLAAVSWALVLFRSGGVDTSIMGVRISTHDWRRPLLASSVLLTTFLLAGGSAPWARVFGQWLRQLAVVRWILAGARRLRWSHAATLLVLAATMFSLSYGTRVAGGADSYGYVSQAHLWARGALTQPMPIIAQVPWPQADSTFTPLGYRPTQDRAGLVPIYSPGLPLLMAGLQVVAGDCAVFWAVPIAVACLCLFTYLLGVRIGSPAVGVVALWLLVTSPIVLYMSVNPMSDVPAAAAWAGAVLFAIGRTRLSASAAVIATAMAILIRPNLAPSAVVIAAWLFWTAWRADAGARRQAIARLILFGLCALPGVLIVAAVNWTLFGSPLESGYGRLSGLFDRANVPTNVRHYATWIATTQTPLVFAGLLAIVLPIRTLWPAARDRSVVLVFGGIVLSVWLHYLFYAPFDAWWFMRFLLPCWPFIMVGFAAALVLCGTRFGPSGRTVTVIVTLAVGLFGLWTGERNDVTRLWRGERRYTTMARLVREHTPRNSVIFSMQHSGTLRLYAGRTTVRYDFLPPGHFDQAIAWFTERGIAVYLAAEAWEMPGVRSQFGAEQVARVLDAPPVLRYEGPATILFYDLRAPQPIDSVAPVFLETYDPPTCVPPVRLPTLSIAR